MNRQRSSDIVWIPWSSIDRVSDNLREEYFNEKVPTQKRKKKNELEREISFAGIEDDTKSRKRSET